MSDYLKHSIMYYAIRTSYYNWGHGPIYNRQGEIIMKHHINESNNGIDIFDLKNNLLFSVKRTANYKVQDSKGNLVAFIKKKFSRLYAKNPSGEILFYSKIGQQFNYDIRTESGFLKASVKNTQNWKEIFDHVIFEFGDIIGIEIYEKDLDRRIILSLMFAMDHRHYKNKRYLNNL